MLLATDIIEHADLAAAVEQSADSIVITGADGAIRYVNPAFTAMTGYSREESVGQNPRILKSGRQSREAYQKLWNTIGSGQVWRGELINRRKDGTLYNEEMQITPVFDSNGRIASFIAIKRDVTGRRAAQDAQGFLAAIVASSEDAIYTYSPDGILQTWNHGAEGIFGYSASEVIGKHVSMLLAPERRPFLGAAIERIMQGAAIPQYEGNCVHRDGRVFPVAVTLSPVRNHAGAVAAVSVILRDISKRREISNRAPCSPPS